MDGEKKKAGSVTTREAEAEAEAALKSASLALVPSKEERANMTNAHFGYCTSSLLTNHQKRYPFTTTPIPHPVTTKTFRITLWTYNARERDPKQAFLSI